MLRSNRKISRHAELLEYLVLHPLESKSAMEETGLPNGTPLTNREERVLLRSIKERVNGSDHSRQES